MGLKSNEIDDGTWFKNRYETEVAIDSLNYIFKYSEANFLPWNRQFDALNWTNQRVSVWEWKISSC